MELNKDTSSYPRKFARRLLTTTCLTAAAVGAVQAGTIGTINESTVGGADFGNTFVLRTSLGTGVTEVIGAVNSSDNDFFQIAGLLGGSPFTITGLYTGSANYAVLSSAQSVLAGGISATNASPLTGTIPGDGILVLQVLQNEGAATYDLTITAATTATPEPDTLAAMGLGLAGAFALRRKLVK